MRVRPAPALADRLLLLRTAAAASLLVAALLVQASELAAQTTLIPKGAVWKYLDDGSDQGTAWRAPSFNDSGWASGAAELGYGDGGEATVISFGPDPHDKYVTAYFRKEFHVANPAAFRGVRLGLLRDDGPIVYLNGVEVHRWNLVPPSLPVDYRTRAIVDVHVPHESWYYADYLDPSVLRPGRNVIAVELHQGSPSSTDLSFDLELHGLDSAPRIIGSPYLQTATPSAMTICWETDQLASTGVWLGPQPDQLALVHQRTRFTRRHQVRLQGLAPLTRYYYAVGTAGARLAGGDANHRFETPPAGRSGRTLRVWVLGDSGTGDAVAEAVRDLYQRFTANQRTDAILMLGDNAYTFGTALEHRYALLDTYAGFMRQVPVWPAFGNHEEYTSDANLRIGPFFDTFALPTASEAGGVASGTESYYSFDLGPVHFVCLDSTLINQPAGFKMLQWLFVDLAASTQADWTIVYCHHPPHTRGTHDSDDPNDSFGRMRLMRQAVMPMLDHFGVDLVLAGHSHTYERSYLVDRFYGLSSEWNAARATSLLDPGDGDDRAWGHGAYRKGRGGHGGAVHAVVGCSGKGGAGLLDHPMMAVSQSTIGSMILDIEGSRLVGQFLDYRGSIVDRFVIEKTGRPTLLRDRASLQLGSGGSQVLRLEPGLAHANGLHVLLGSLGTSPGLWIGALHLPLNFDPWMQLNLSPRGSLYQNHIGFLDGAGRAQASIQFPPSNDPSLIDLSLHHAFLVFDAAMVPVMASHGTRLKLLR